MPSVQRELGEIKAKIEILTRQNQEISETLDELKESSLTCAHEIKTLVSSMSIYKKTQESHYTRLNNIEKGLASKVLTSVSAIVASIFAVLYVILN